MLTRFYVLFSLLAYDVLVLFRPYLRYLTKYQDAHSPFVIPLSDSVSDTAWRFMFLSMLQGHVTAFYYFFCPDAAVFHLFYDSWFGFFVGIALQASALCLIMNAQQQMGPSWKIGTPTMISSSPKSDGSAKIILEKKTVDEKDTLDEMEHATDTLLFQSVVLSAERAADDLSAYSETKKTIEKKDWVPNVSPKKESGLVQTGLFARCRHPICSGAIMSAVGLFILFPTAMTLVQLEVIVVIISMQVRLEEEYLRNKFGDEFDLYAKRTPNRFLNVFDSASSIIEWHSIRTLLEKVWKSDVVQHVYHSPPVQKVINLYLGKKDA